MGSEHGHTFIRQLVFKSDHKLKVNFLENESEKSPGTADASAT